MAHEDPIPPRTQTTAPTAQEDPVPPRTQTSAPTAHEDPVPPRTQEEAEELRERLDPETKARRDAALRVVRKYGDPVLRSRALPIERFDESLVEEARRMGKLMNDALGIGLAATQVGVMHRLLVYRVDPDAPVAALVNPVLEWSGEERETMEEGCLSLPGVLVEVERPIRVRVRAQDERGDDMVIEAAGLEARVLQHEMDHLDGVLILDRTSRDQRKQAMRAMREASAPRPSASAPRPPAACGPSTSAPRASRPRCSSGWRRAPHRPALVITRPDAPRGRGRKLAAPPVADTARELGIELAQPERLHDEEMLARIAAAEPEVLCVCAYGALIREPLLSAYELLNVHPSLLPRWRGAAPVERAIMAGDEETGVSIMRLVAELDAGPVCLQGREPIHADDDYGTLAARLERLGGDLLVRALDERPPFTEQDDALVTYAHKIEARDRTLDFTRPPEEVERAVRALRPHIGARLPAARRRAAGRDRRRGRRRDARARRRPRARRGRAAAAGLQRRRARADRDPAARRAPDARRRMAARAPRRRHRDTCSTRRCPSARWRSWSSWPAREWNSDAEWAPYLSALAYRGGRGRAGRRARAGHRPRPGRARRRRLRARPARRRGAHVPRASAPRRSRRWRPARPIRRCWRRSPTASATSASPTASRPCWS